MPARITLKRYGDVMSTRDFLFTSESVSEGHPDKVCDQISDGILDALFQQDPKSRVAIETMVKTGMVMLAGEITTSANVSYETIVRDVLKNIGYDSEATGFNADQVAVMTNISQQSPDIAQGVNEDEGTYTEQGAGDQGIMFGYACQDTPELMPLPIALSHRLVRRLADHRKAEKVNYLYPDSKSQVTVQYVDGKPQSVETVVVSTHHSEDVDLKTLEEFVVEEVVKDVIPDNFLTDNTRYLINPTGRFVVGGPQADAGLTGRKIIVDTYGGYSRHGGGAFSGKDPSKVDRSAAYASRYVAKNIVAAGLATDCEIELAYAIGVAEPVSIYVDTFGTGKIPDSAIADAIPGVFNFAPRAIIEQLDLLKPIYSATAAYGHFGRNPRDDGSFSWEQTNLVDELKKLL